MKRFFSALAALFLLANVTASSTASAYTVNSQVFQIRLASGGTQAVVSFAGGTFFATDACATGTNPSGSNGTMAFSLATNEGKSMLSLLTAAMLAGKKVTVMGTTGNNCTSTSWLNFIGGTTTFVYETVGQVEVLQ